MSILLFIGVWFSCIVLGLLFFAGATRKDNIARDPDYYKR